MTEHEQSLAYTQRKLINAALQYARVSSLGRYLHEDETWVIMGGNDAKDYADHFTREMQRVARRLLAERSTATLPDASHGH